MGRLITVMLCLISAAAIAQAQHNDPAALYRRALVEEAGGRLLAELTLVLAERKADAGEESVKRYYPLSAALGKASLGKPFEYRGSQELPEALRHELAIWIEREEEPGGCWTRWWQGDASSCLGYEGRAGRARDLLAIALAQGRDEDAVAFAAEVDPNEPLYAGTFGDSVGVKVWDLFALPLLARAHFLEAAALEPVHGVEKGLFMYHAKRYDDAARLFEQVNDEWASVYLASCRFHLGDRSEAQRLWEGLVGSQRPDIRAEAAYLRAQCTGPTEEDIRVLRSCLDSVFDSKTPLIGQQWYAWRWAEVVLDRIEQTGDNSLRYQTLEHLMEFLDVESFERSDPLFLMSYARARVMNGPLHYEEATLTTYSLVRTNPFLRSLYDTMQSIYATGITDGGEFSQ